MLTYTNKIKVFRAMHSLTQADLAKFLGLTRTGYQQKEYGVREFTVGEALKLINLFDASFESIFFANSAHDV